MFRLTGCGRDCQHGRACDPAKCTGIQRALADAEFDWLDHPVGRLVAAIVLVVVCYLSASYPLPWFGG